MNRTDLADLKKNFKADSAYLQMNSVLTAYVRVTGLDKEVMYKKVRPFEEFSKEEAEIHLAILKKVLSGKLSKNALQLSFAPQKQDAKKLFYDLRNSRLNQEELMDAFLERVVKESGYNESFYITCLFCDYTLPVKDKNNEILDEEFNNRFSFLLTAFNKAALTKIGLVYDKETEEVVKKTNVDMQIQNAVMDGFMYPALTDGGADLNSLIYYTSKPKEPNLLMAEDFLGCEYQLTMEEEENAFHSLVEDLYTDNISFQTISRLQESMLNVVEEAKEEEDEVTLDKQSIKDVLENAGIQERAMSRFEASYNKNIDNKPIYAANTLNTDKIDIVASGIKISAKISEKDRIKTQIVDGRHVLLIELSGPMLYNGFEVTPGPEKEDTQNH